MAIKFEVLSWEDIIRLIYELCKKIEKSNWTFDCIVTILRGGLIPARIVADYFNVSDVYVLGLSLYADVSQKKQLILKQPLNVDLQGKKVLLVDDVADTGESLIFARNYIIKELKPKEVKIATIHMKPWSKIEPDFYVKKTDAWIVYPWEYYETLISLEKKIKAISDSHQKNILIEAINKIKKYLSMFE